MILIIYLNALIILLVHLPLPMLIVEENMTLILTHHLLDIAQFPLKDIQISHHQQVTLLVVIALILKNISVLATQDLNLSPMATNRALIVVEIMKP